MTLVRDAIRYPVTTAVGVILVVLFGALALFRIPIQLTPDVDEPNITVSTVWPGASPQEIEPRSSTSKKTSSGRSRVCSVWRARALIARVKSL